LPHAFADGVEERPACILHQMPAVGDLNCLRERSLGRPGVAATAISGDYANLRLAAQPRFCACRLPIRQQRNCPSTFEVAEKRSVAVVSLPGPIVDADYRRRRELSGAATAYDAKQGVVAHPDIETP
jgi:hypothetical protein